jgi:hypothetical protein
VKPRKSEIAGAIVLFVVLAALVVVLTYAAIPR